LIANKPTDQIITLTQTQTQLHNTSRHTRTHIYIYIYRENIFDLLNSFWRTIYRRFWISCVWEKSMNFGQSPNTMGCAPTI